MAEIMTNLTVDPLRSDVRSAPSASNTAMTTESGVRRAHVPKSISINALFDTARTYSLPDPSNLDAQGNAMPMCDKHGRRVFNAIRAALHEHIVNDLLQAGTTREKPTIMFTAGPYGAGKSYILGAIRELGIVNLDEYIVVDPDKIKTLLPEFATFQGIDRKNAATAVHDESGHIQELLVEAALQQGKNLIIDGSLAAKEWWTGEFKRVKETYPSYEISILYVDAAVDTLLDRVEARAHREGRDIPEAKVRWCAEAVAESIEALTPLTAATIKITNGNDGAMIDSVHMDGRRIPRGTFGALATKERLAEFHLPSQEELCAKRHSPSQTLELTSIRALHSAAKNRPVTVVLGQTEFNYEFRDVAEKALSALVKQAGGNRMYVIPAGEKGISEAAEWIGKVAGRLNLEGVEIYFIPATGLDQPSLLEQVISGNHATDVWSIGIDDAAERLLTIALTADNDPPPKITAVQGPHLGPDQAELAFVRLGDAHKSSSRLAEFTSRHCDKPNLTVIDYKGIGSTVDRESVLNRIRSIHKMKAAEILEVLPLVVPEIMILASSAVKSTVEAAVTDLASESLRHAPKPSCQLQEILARCHGHKIYQAIGGYSDDLGTSFSQALFGLETGQQFTEFDRTAMNVLILAQLLGGADRYNELVEAQLEQATAVGAKIQQDDPANPQIINNPPLSSGTANRLSSLIRSVVNNPDVLEAMIVSVSLTNLGKSQDLIKYLEKSDPDLALNNHQQVLFAALQKYPWLFPSFDRLSFRQKKVVLDSLELELNINQINQGEHTTADLLELIRYDAESYRFYVVSAIVKLGGALGFRERRGSVTLSEQTVANMLTVLEKMKPVVADPSPEICKRQDRDLWVTRAIQLGLDMFGITLDDQVVLAKLCSQLRIFDPRLMPMVVEEYRSLHDEVKSILRTEYLRSGLDGEPAKKLYMSPGMAASFLGLGKTRREAVGFYMRKIAEGFQAIEEHCALYRDSVPGTTRVADVRPLTTQVQEYVRIHGKFPDGPVIVRHGSPLELHLGQVQVMGWSHH